MVDIGAILMLLGISGLGIICFHTLVKYDKAKDKITNQAELIHSLQEALKEAEERIAGLLRETPQVKK